MTSITRANLLAVCTLVQLSPPLMVLDDAWYEYGKARVAAYNQPRVYYCAQIKLPKAYYLIGRVQSQKASGSMPGWR